MTYHDDTVVVCLVNDDVAMSWIILMANFQMFVQL
jgi:hypothetical protein